MKASETNVLNFIGGLDKVFIIPPFQRNYEWTKEQCLELFKDIEYAFKKQKTHYLGNVVYFLGKNNGAEFTEVVLIDGQQRITTIELLLCALRDFERKENFQEKINQRYLINSTSEKQFRIRLKQTSYDYESFISIVEGKNIKNEESNLVKNYRYFLELLENTELSIKDIYETIIKLEIVGVNLQIEDDLEAVQTIFEKINSTGKPLSAADLIRNYLLLSTSSSEQEKLYNNYWIKIENNVGNNNISLLAKNYTILKTYKDVENTKIYQAFRDFFDENSYTREEILVELENYSKYFYWINENKCPDNNINKHIIELNALKTDDIYPLYMYILSELYDSDKKETEQIFKLLSDFFIRYRIVAPSGGGGVIRTMVHQLLEKLIASEIELSFISLYYELSNSSTKTGRYPNNEDFKQALMMSRKPNHTYGKVLLRKIEEYETKNIGVPLSEITVEHFMPQKLTPWWQENLGGLEQSYIVYDAYLNCIGNLGIMSQGYNSINSNDNWPKKLEQIKQVQFNITKEVAKNKEWNVPQIEERNKDIAERACCAILPPQERSKPLTIITAETGVYSANDLETNMSGAELTDVLFEKKSLGINSWRNFFNIACKIVHEKDSSKFDRIVRENLIHKATSNQNGKDKDPIIVTSEQLKDNSKILRNAKQIEGTNYFSEACLSSERVRVYAKQLLDLYGITKDFELCINNKEDE